jgi:hypothetical protein
LDFGPGDEILAKIRCEASKYPDLAQASGIAPEHSGNWLLCEVLDKCAGTSRKTPVKSEVLHVERGDLLMVPRYLAGSVIRVKSRSYTRLLYSRMIRPAHTRARPVDFQQHTTMTQVIPDHFYTGAWSYMQDRFALDTHFVLASDGFYECFEDPADLWSWLVRHSEDLQDPSERQELLGALHHTLQEGHSDDDISFVWVFPRQSDKHPLQARAGVQQKGGDDGR